MLLAPDADEAYATINPAEAPYYAPKAQAKGFAPIWPSVICALVFCLPFGIAAMLFALSSRAAAADGDLLKAAKAKRRSKLLCALAVAFSALMIILLLVLTTG